MLATLAGFIIGAGRRAILLPAGRRAIASALQQHLILSQIQCPLHFPTETAHGRVAAAF